MSPRPKCGSWMYLTIQFRVLDGWFSSNYFCDGFLLVMPHLQVKFTPFEIFLDFTWGSNYINNCKNSLLCSVFWIFFLFLLKLNLGHENEFYCIWSKLTKWSLRSLVSTPVWFFWKKLKIECFIEVTSSTCISME